MIFRDEDIKELVKTEAQTIIKEIVFNSCILFERLEYNGMLDCDGYKLRKKLANYAADLLERHFKNV